MRSSFAPPPRPLRLLALLPVLTLAVAPVAAHAEEEDEQKKAMATDLFDRGVKIMVAHKCDETVPIPPADRASCAEALDYFVKATRAYPRALGAHRNAAFVAKGLGKVALAARSFREVARKAPLEASESRKRWAPPAAKEAEALEPRVPHVVIRVGPAVPAGIVVKLDGDAIDERLLKTQLSLDPGEHEVTAEAKDHKPTSRKFTIAEKELVDLALTLEPLPKPLVAAPPPEAPPPPPEKPKTLAPMLVTIGGGVLIGVGLVFGASAKSARDACANHLCKSEDEIDKAYARARLANVFTIAGGAVAAGGAVWWIASSRSGEAPRTGLSPMFAPGGGGLVATRVLP